MLTRSIRVGLVLGLIALGLAALPAVAGQNRAQSETIHFSGADEPFELGEPACGLPADAMIYQTFSGVIHITEGANGRHHETSRFQGSITVVVPGGDTYVGHYADRDAWNVNPRNETYTLTSNNVVRAAAGATISFHFQYRLIVGPDGEVTVEIFRLTCGGSA